MNDERSVTDAESSNNEDGPIIIDGQPFCHCGHALLSCGCCERDGCRCECRDLRAFPATPEALLAWGDALPRGDSSGKITIDI